MVMSEVIRVSYEEKIRLGAEVRELGPGKLGEIVALIKSRCPEAYREVDEDSCQIVVDNIGKRVLEMINEKLSEITGGKRVKTK